jgi:hypothetical protein
MLDFTHELLFVMEAFQKANIPYAFYGGVAVVVHGGSHLMRGMELLLQETDLERALKILKTGSYNFEFNVMISDAEKLQERKLIRIAKHQRDDTLSIDLMLVTLSLQDVWRNRQLYKANGRSFWVVSFDGLIKMKNSPNDETDKMIVSELEAGIWNECRG